MDERQRKLEFGRKLRQLRRNRNMSAEELGAKFGLSKTTIWGYEQGYRIPDMDTITKMAEFFNVSVDYLVGHNLDQTNARNILSRRDLTWDGVPLDEEDLEKVKEFLTWVIRKKLPKWEEEQKKRIATTIN